MTDAKAASLTQYQASLNLYPAAELKKKYDK
jgi:hypothetical protein